MAERMATVIDLDRKRRQRETEARWQRHLQETLQRCSDEPHEVVLLDEAEKFVLLIEEEARLRVEKNVDRLAEPGLDHLSLGIALDLVELVLHRPARHLLSSWLLFTCCRHIHVIDRACASNAPAACRRRPEGQSRGRSAGRRAAASQLGKAVSSLATRSA